VRTHLERVCGTDKAGPKGEEVAASMPEEPRRRQEFWPACLYACVPNTGVRM
jgi:hypothetical protein